MTGWPLWLAPPAVLAAAVLTYNRFWGRRLLWELWREFSTARADLTALDRFCAGNPSRSDMIISLTTIPSRLPLIADTLKSLLGQSKAPAEIRLYLPGFSKREQVAYVVPPALRQLQSVRLYENEEDLGPATKFLSSLAGLLPDQKLLVVDDDHIYPPDMIDCFDRAIAANPDAAYCLGGQIVLPDLVDRKVTLSSVLRHRPPAQLSPARLRQPKQIDILMGVHGYVVRPRFFDLARLRDYTTAPPEAFFADDIWLSAHCRVPKYAIPSPRVDFQPYRHIPLYDRTSLGWLNRRGEPERWISTTMLRYFGPTRWLAGRVGDAPIKPAGVAECSQPDI